MEWSSIFVQFIWRRSPFCFRRQRRRIWIQHKNHRWIRGIKRHRRSMAAICRWYANVKSWSFQFLNIYLRFSTSLFSAFYTEKVSLESSLSSSWSLRTLHSSYVGGASKTGIWKVSWNRMFCMFWKKGIRDRSSKIELKYDGGSDRLSISTSSRFWNAVFSVGKEGGGYIWTSGPSRKSILPGKRSWWRSAVEISLNWAFEENRYYSSAERDHQDQHVPGLNWRIW